MADTAAAAAAEGAANPGDEGGAEGAVDDETTTGDEGEGTEGDGQGDDAGEGKGQQGEGKGGKTPSELVRLVRDNKRKDARIAALEAAAKGGGDGKTTSRTAVVSELKAQYEADPTGFIQELTGEDFTAMARRVAAKAKGNAGGTELEELRAKVAELEGRTGAHDQRVADADQRARDERHATNIANVAKALDDVDEDGTILYPTLRTLDPDVLDEPLAQTAYDAVTHAWIKECCKHGADGKPERDAGGKFIQVKKWTDDDYAKRFRGAFKKLEAHYAKLRTPHAKTLDSQDPDAADDASPTIENNRSSGPVHRPATRKHPGTLSVEEALAKNLREMGLS